MALGEEVISEEEPMQIDPAQVAEQIEEFIHCSVDEFQRDGVLLGMSGGIDSAVVVRLATRALEPGQVKVLLLPERDSIRDSRTDALLEIERLGIQYEEVSLTPMLSAMGIYDVTPLRVMTSCDLKLLGKQSTSGPRLGLESVAFRIAARDAVVRAGCLSGSNSGVDPVPAVPCLCAAPETRP